MSSLEERMRQFNAACAEAGRPDIQAIGPHPVDPERLFIVGKDLDKPKSKQVVWRATYLVRNGQMNLCLRCFAFGPPPEEAQRREQLGVAYVCPHPKEWKKQ
jgi:hypothetical protein